MLGFKGAEAEEAEPGTYLIRQEHAHSWVEALVPAGAPAGRDPGPEQLWRWLSLDPTPSVDAVAAATPAPGWVQSAARSAREFLGNLFGGGWLRDLPAARGGRLAVWVLAVVVASASAKYVLSRRVGAAVSPAPGVVYYDALRRLAETFGLAAAPGEAPVAHAERLRAGLLARGLPPDLAAIPAELTADFYRERFAGEVAPEGLARRNAQRLAELEQAAQVLRPERGASALRVPQSFSAR